MAVPIDPGCARAYGYSRSPLLLIRLRSIQALAYVAVPDLSIWNYVKAELSVGQLHRPSPTQPIGVRYPNEPPHTKQQLACHKNNAPNCNINLHVGTRPKATVAHSF